MRKYHVRFGSGGDRGDPAADHNGSMAREPRTFTTEFKLEAVRLAQTSGKRVSQVARDLGIA